MDKETLSESRTNDVALDHAVDVRPEDALDAGRLLAYLASHVDGISAGDDIGIQQFPGGASNLTYLIRVGNREIILRKPPRGTKAASAHDMSREYRVLSALEPHFPYCPGTLAFCDDHSVIGSDFYLMNRLEGLIPRREMPVRMSAEQHTELCHHLIDCHATLHAVDYRKAGLESLGKPEGYVKRQVSGWSDRYRRARTDDVPSAENLMRWLDEQQPADSTTSCLIHNDYKFDNVVLDPNQPTRIIGVLDWEMATLGDPLMDLGCSLAYWIEASDPEPLQRIRQMPTHLPGMMTREEVIRYYQQVSGLTVPDFRFYYVFGLFRLAVIVQQIYYRYSLGQTTNPKFSQFSMLANVLIRHAESAV